MLTTLYPADDVKFLNNTAVCHYFAKEWVQSGYNVRVFFLYNLFPRVFYPLLRLWGKKLANSSGLAILDKFMPDEHDYIMDGVKITRIPVKKSRPGGDYKSTNIAKVSNRICEILQNENFSPDLIVSHFLHPSLEVINCLKKKYNVPTAISLHGKEKIYSEQTARNLEAIDFMGYRSWPIGKCFETLYGKKPSFFCYSGVPSKFIHDKPKSFEKGIHNFIYVGSLIYRKHPSCLIPAISKVMVRENFSITFVGDGNQQSVIRKLAAENNCLDKLIFTGRIDRDLVTKELDKAEVFIMLSSNETFGLVYLEAMARGCIVVASVDEGMEGIIKNGINGFLCKAGDSEDLFKTLTCIKSMSKDQLQAISESALQTAKSMSDKREAEEYINFFKDK